MSTERKKRILIIDDSEIECKRLKDFLVKKDMEVIFTHNGNECLELIDKNKIDLILLDILMPEISGIEVLRIIRDKYNQITLPVLMLTVKSEASDVIDALKIGANDYITKPANFEVLISRLNTHFKMAELSKENAEKKEIEAIDAMIVTYYHELRQPLTTATAGIYSLKKKGDPDGKYIKVISDSVTRLADIVDKIAGITENKVRYENYAGGEAKLLKLK